MWIATALVGLSLLAGGEDRVSARLSAEPAVVAPGGAVRIRLELDVRPGWHVYGPDFDGTGEKTSVVAELPSGFALRGLEWPPTQLPRRSC